MRLSRDGQHSHSKFREARLTPSGRFEQEDAANAQETGRNKLDSKRNSPLHVAVRDGPVDSVIDPET